MASKKEEILQVAEDENVDSIIKRLDKSVADKIILFAPPNAYFFASAENLKAIQEKMKEKSAEWFLLTDDKLGQKYAGILGIKLMGEVKKERSSKKEFLSKEEVSEIESSKKRPSLGEWFSKFKHELPIKKRVEKEDAQDMVDEIKEEIEQEELIPITTRKKNSLKEVGEETNEELETEEDVLDYGSEPEEEKMTFNSLKKIVGSHESKVKKITIISFASAVLLLMVFVGKKQEFRGRVRRP